MTNYREILRLHSLGLNKTEIASSCQCARNTVAATLQRAANCGLQWPLPEEMSDKQLSERLFPSSTSKPVYKVPDYASVHKELQRSGVTLNLLWLEYCDQCKAEGAVQISQVLKRDERVHEGSEEIWAYAKSILEENVKKGRLGSN